ncbi:MAG: DUF190 domain-containing protein [Beijerinckiaceae bacterium]|nr:MAG: DUF190 domain-containing protein [Beijerinckiaceae bacterium]
MAAEVTVVRIYLSEADHKHGKTLMQDILDILHEQHKVRCVTVLRGIAGIGDTGEVHAANMLRIMVDLPIIIEFFDTPEVVNSVLELLDDLLPTGHIVSWPATCR